MDRNDPVVAAALEMAPNCVGSRSRIISRAITRIFDDELRDVGVTVTQLIMLGFVAVYGEVRPSDLAEPLSMDLSTISRTTGRMVDQGWLAKVPAEDERGYNLVITPRGRELVLKGLPAWRRAQERAVEILTPQGARTIREIADSIRGSAGD